MQWVIALNDAGPAFPQYSDLAKVAIHTARERTSLVPHLIYDGKENDFTRWARSRGVRILPWRSALFTELTALGRTLPNQGFAGALPGIFLRVDLPVIGERYGLDEYVLYTDCDVMFRAEVVEELASRRCRYFAVAAESERASKTDMNSGVMWMHLPALRERQALFWEFIREQVDELYSYSWDQGAYARFYLSTEGKPLWDTLPPELNWKPYWERSAAARIIHFHGPKPFQQPYIESHFPELLHLAGPSFDELCVTWRKALAAANASGP